MAPATIVLADDHVLIRRGLRKIIDSDPAYTVIGEVNDGLELHEFLRETCPDLILLDVSMPNLRGIEAIKEAKKYCPRAKILMLTMHSSRDILCSAIKAGADGYVLKEDSDVELLSALGKCLRGDYYLSPALTKGMADEDIKRICANGESVNEKLSVRERQILTLVADGKKSRDIAEMLSISIRTVEHHRANIMKKTGIRNTAELIKYAIQKGYVTNSP